MRRTGKFGKYSRADLLRLGRRFLEEVAGHRDHSKWGTEEWTEQVLDWFSADRAEHVVVHARAPRGARSDVGPRAATRGEYLVDLAHSTWPGYAKPRTRAYWNEALAPEREPKLELLLALECEWGKVENARETLHRVMQDAAKLLHLAARAKVVVFSGTNQQNSGDLLGLLRRLAARDPTRAPWLFIDVPWSRDPATFELSQPPGETG
ncbi:MAG: hypothetical protein IT376_10220 [Polyangiaceae bacterium]|nr:hypothetical protein [Polyangiaceae bacterium]